MSPSLAHAASTDEPLGPASLGDAKRICRMVLADGRAFELEGRPKRWKSVLMRQAPYGTDFQGAMFEVA